MKNLFRISVFLFLGIVLLHGKSYADVSNKVAFQGRLTNSAGSPITASNKTFTFDFFDDPANGSLIFSLNTSTDIKNGLYSALLDFSSVTPAQLNQPLYVKVTYDGNPMITRTALGSSPYALAVKDGVITSSKIVDLSVTGAKLENINASPMTYGETSSRNLVSGSTFTVLQASVDTKGRVTLLNARTMTMPTGLAPSGTAGGDLTGTYPNPVLSTVTTAGTVGENASRNLVSNSTFTVLQATIDAKGRVTALNARQMTLPSGSPIGAAGGDLTGTYPNPVLSTVTAAATRGESGDRSLVSNSTFTVLQATIDTKGRVTALNARQMTLPAIPSVTGFEQTSNKETLTLTNSTTTYPASSVMVSTLNALRTAVNNKVDSNAVIVGNTFPKITYDAKGLVTSGTLLMASDIPALAVYVDTYSAQNIAGVKTFQNNVFIGTGGAELSYGSFTTSSGPFNGLIVGTNLKAVGVVSSSGGFVTANADLAEIYPSSDILNPGDVVIISEIRDGYIEKSKTANDTKVAGVVSTKPGIILNSDANGYQLALVGKVPVNVTNEGGNIKRGDLLVASSTPGYAMKAPENSKPGTIIGKAMENSTGTRGKILALVNLQ